MFLMTADLGRYVNAQYITNLTALPRDSDGEPRYGANGTMADGTSVRLFDDIDTILDKSGPFVPAQPGFEVLGYWVDENGRELIDRQPVVAWRCDDVEGARPVTLDAQPEEFAVKYPDGQVVLPWDRTFDNEDAWMVAMREMAEKKRSHSAQAGGSQDEPKPNESERD